MAALGIRLFTDEMVNTALAVELRRRGYDALSCKEAGRANQNISDEAQLEFATGEGRAVLTFNVGHYVQLDAAWRAADREHAGLILSPEYKNLGTLIKVALKHLDTVTPAAQHNLVLWLPSR